MALTEQVLRLSVFVAVFAILAAAEALRPRRRPVSRRARRWPTNLGLVAISSVLLRGLVLVPVPLTAVLAALFAATHGIGVFNAGRVETAIAIPATVVVLDFAVWAQHVAFHRVGALWRLHRVHHADRDFDLTTGIRFHPVEMVLSGLYKAAWVLALGAPVAGVVAFEIVLNATAMFSHANVRLPSWLDRALRLVVVTPDMHRVHHSVLPAEHHCNFGFALSVWDRLLGTYLAQPQHGHDGMTIGLEPWLDGRSDRLGWALAAPVAEDLRSEAAGPAMAPHTGVLPG